MYTHVFFSIPSKIVYLVFHCRISVICDTYDAAGLGVLLKHILASSALLKDILSVIVLHIHVLFVKK